MTTTTVQKTWETTESPGLAIPTDSFYFLFEFTYEDQKFTGATVTISSADAPANEPVQPDASPPPSPAEVPITVDFIKNTATFDAITADKKNRINGSFQLKSLNVGQPGDNGAVWANLNWGPDLYHHFIGVNVTFSSTAPASPPTSEST